MTGLEKIIGQINSDTDESVSSIIAKANDEADRIKAEASKKADDTCNRIKRESNIRLSDQKSRAESAAALAKRQLLLEEKQKLIAEVISKAKESFYEMSEDEYFNSLLTLVSKNVLAQDGEILFSQKDKSRLPADFADKLAATAASKNGTLKISDETRKIDGGFILVYGGIEQNCSISALFETNSEILADKIQSMLFKS